MKSFLNFLLLQNFKSEETDIGEARPGARVYWQLTKMMKSFNPNFSQRKYWLYGCNCVMLGNNQISDPGYGPPLDELDTACKRNKNCLRLKMPWISRNVKICQYLLLHKIIYLQVCFNSTWKLVREGIYKIWLREFWKRCLFCQPWKYLQTSSLRMWSTICKGFSLLKLN